MTSSARMRLRHRPDLSLRADPPRTSRTAASFLFVFLYAVPSEQREQLDELGRDYLAPVRRTGVDDSFEVYDVVEDGPEARQLIVRASAGAPEFLASEDALNAHTAGPEFDAIGVRAERLLSSVETFPVVRLSERWAPSPWLRGL